MKSWLISNTGKTIRKIEPSQIFGRGVGGWKCFAGIYPYISKCLMHVLNVPTFHIHQYGLG